MIDSSRNTDDGLGAKLKRLPAEIMLLVEKKLELWAIQFAETVADKTSALITQLVAVILLLSGLFFVFFGTAFWLNELLASTWAGFVLQGAVFLFLGLIVLVWKNAFWRKSIQKSVATSILTGMGYGTDSDNPKKTPASVKEGSDVQR
jgi:uncharacterized membrane protein YqjE